MTSSRNDGLTGLSLWSFHFLTIFTTGFHCLANASLAAVAFSAWMRGLVLIQPPWRRSGIV